MAIPDYQSLMLPLLSLAADGQEHSIRDDRLWPGRNHHRNLWVETRRFRLFRRRV